MHGQLTMRGQPTNPPTMRAGDTQALFAALLATLPSSALPASDSGSCDENGLSALVNRYPPTTVDFSAVSRTGLKYEWTISDQTHGNGQYIVEASSVYNAGGLWHASYAFDHNPTDADLGTTWHKATNTDDPHWLMIELPEAMKLRYYTLSNRKCCGAQFPQKWELTCVDDPGAPVTLDTRSGQVLGDNQCRIYPSQASGSASLCKKLKITMEGFSSVREWALYADTAGA